MWKQGSALSMAITMGWISSKWFVLLDDCHLHSLVPIGTFHPTPWFIIAALPIQTTRAERFDSWHQNPKVPSRDVGLYRRLCDDSAQSQSQHKDYRVFRPGQLTRIPPYYISLLNRIDTGRQKPEWRECKGIFPFYLLQLPSLQTMRFVQGLGGASMPSNQKLPCSYGANTWMNTPSSR